MTPLQDLLVLDFTTLLPGPLATLWMREAGARVIKIERPPIGDEMREYEPRFGSTSVNFALLNAGKESLALDLKDDADRARLEPLLLEADVLVEQFRPGVMARLGLDYATLKSRNPGLIYCSITGYGQSGPKAQVAAHDLNYIADTGLLSLVEPALPPVLVADIGGGSYPALANVLLALLQRANTGEGAWLDISMTDNLFPWTYWAMGNGVHAGRVAASLGQPGDGWVAAVQRVQGRGRAIRRGGRSRGPILGPTMRTPGSRRRRARRSWRSYRGQGRGGTADRQPTERPLARAVRG